MERDMETDPGGVMERQLVEKYLSTRGHTLRSVRDLPEAVRRPLLAAAARYASQQITEGDTDSQPGVRGSTVELQDPREGG
jgi:hypothetical protein